MPFAKIRRGKNAGKFRGPSGRVFTKNQVRLHAAIKQSTPSFSKRVKK